MAGYFLREAAVLVLVFAILDPIVFGEKFGIGWPAWLAIVFSVTAVLLIAGIFVELYWS